ncbi:MAG: hypothetical protein ACRCR9_07010 [Chitinophagaceae bacterium]
MFWRGANSTGIILAGIINAALPSTQVIGINCLKYPLIHQEIDTLLKHPKIYSILSEYYFLGFS